MKNLCRNFPYFVAYVLRERGGCKRLLWWCRGEGETHREKIPKGRERKERSVFQNICECFLSIAPRFQCQTTVIENHPCRKQGNKANMCFAVAPKTLYWSASGLHTFVFLNVLNAYNLQQRGTAAGIQIQLHTRPGTPDDIESVRCSCIANFKVCMKPLFSSFWIFMQIKCVFVTSVTVW